jgi:uncharacterized protein DUF4383
VSADLARGPVRERAPLSDLALLASLALIVLGVAGFIPGITTHYKDLGWAGDDSGAQLLGAFQVSALLNLVHIAVGLVGLGLSWTNTGARVFLVGGGLLYLALALYGVLTPQDSAWNFIPLDPDDDSLHLGLGLALFVPAVLPRRAPGWSWETLGGFLAAAAIFVSLVGIAYRPLRLIPFAIVLALLSAAIGGPSGRMAMLAAYIGAACFVLGMAFAVITSHPLW